MISGAVDFLARPLGIPGSCWSCFLGPVPLVPGTGSISGAFGSRCSGDSSFDVSHSYKTVSARVAASLFVVGSADASRSDVGAGFAVDSWPGCLASASEGCCSLSSRAADSSNTILCSVLLSLVATEDIEVSSARAELFRDA